MGAVLLIDIGNTAVALGLGTGRRVIRLTRLRGADCDEAALTAAIGRVTEGRLVSGCCVCSVVPHLAALCGRAVRGVYGREPLWVSAGLDLGIGIDYPRPGTIGPDRLANAAAAFAKYGAPAIVADFGTALTFDVVSRAGAYVGGVIAPGLPLMTDYLADRTALLPRIELRGGRGAVGRSTRAAMRIGARTGYRGMVKEITREVLAAPGMRGAALCATGGFAHWVVDGLSLPFHVEPALTLWGLMHIFERNRVRPRTESEG
jgi:type III pantothenate kinase